MELLDTRRPAYVLEPQSRRSRFLRDDDTLDIDWEDGNPFELPAGDDDITLMPQLFEFSTERQVTRAAPPRSAATTNALFRKLVRQYGASLYYFVLKRVGHPEDAADIAQQAFVEAACSFTRFRGEAEVSTWIFGIATNLSRNHINRAPQFRHRFETDDILEECESPDLSPCECASQRQGVQLVSQAMNQLPPEMAQALNLVAVEELSYEDAAVELNVPVGTVRSRVSRARTAVRKYMRDAGYCTSAA